MNYKKICLLALLFIVGTKINGQSKSNISRNYKVVLKEQNRFKIKKLEVKGITILPNSNLLLGGWNVVEFDINTLNKHKRIPEKKWFNNGMGYISSIVSDNNNYYLVDNRDKRLIRYSILNDTLKYDLKPFKRLEEGIYMGKNNYVVTHFQKSNDWEYQFSIYNIFDKKVTKTYKFKDIIDDKNFSRTCADFQLQGMFSSNLKHTFYVCEKASKFFSFNQDGELLYSKSTLFKPPIAKIKRKKIYGR